MTHIIDHYLYHIVIQHKDNNGMFDNNVDKGVTRSLTKLGFNFDDYTQKKRFYMSRMYIHITRTYYSERIFDVYLDSNILLHTFKMK